MGVFKEEAHVFENIAKKQVRIYNDAADYGYPYNTNKPPPEVTDVYDVISDLSSLKNIVRNRQTWGDMRTGGVSVDVIFFWEQDEGYNVGTKYHISFNRTAGHPSKFDKNANAFLVVDIERYSEKS